MSFDPTNFDPKAHSDQDGGSELLPAANHTLWVRSFKRKQSNGKEQIMFICDAVLDSNGKPVPRNRFAPVFETTTLTADAAWRVANLLNAIDDTMGALNIMSDRELAAAVRFRPFKAKLYHDTYQGNTSARIKGYLPLSGDERSAAAAVLEDRAVDQATGGGYDSHDPGGSYSNGNGGAGRPAAGGSNFDDDIPF